MSDHDFADPGIDITALLDNIDRIRGTIVRSAPDLQTNHHNYVRISAIEGLIDKALKYADSMR